MSLGAKLIQAVQKETAMKRPLPLQATAHDDVRGVGRVTASVKLTDNDRFSHMAEEIKVTVDRSGKHMAGSVEAVARKFADRATYLTESLQFVETDLGGKAVLRSSPETMRGARAPYFEATVKNDELSLKRYQPNQDKAGRTATPFCVTDEVLSRLVDDSTTVLSGSSNK